MYSQRFVIIIYSLLTLGVVMDISLGPKQCVMFASDQCSCILSDGRGVINISSLGNTGGSAKFRDIYGPDNYLYSLNLCYPFNEGFCTDAAACQIQTDRLNSHIIGESSSATFRVDSLDIVHVQYTTYDLDSMRMTDVTLICDPSMDSATVEVNGEEEPDSQKYGFVVTTKCGCGNGCVSAPSTEPTTTPKPDRGIRTNSSPATASTSGSKNMHIIVFLKILFWSFYCYIRAKRKRQAQQDIGRREMPCSRPINRGEDRISIIDQEYLPQGFTNSAEPYSEVEKPPLYDQVVNNISIHGNAHTSEHPDISSVNSLNN